MDTINIKPYDKSEIENKIKKRESFVIRNLDGFMIEATKDLEEIIEDSGLTCRIYSHNRAAVVAATSFIPVVSWINIAAVALHNISTWNPDYEVGKDLVNKVLHVRFKK